MDQYHIRLFRFQNFLHGIQDVRRDIEKCLAILHNVEVIIWYNTEGLQHLIKHLAVLRAAGLVREQRQGRFVNYEVDPDGIASIGSWLARYRAYWPKRIEALSDLLKDMDQ